MTWSTSSQTKVSAKADAGAVVDFTFYVEHSTLTGPGLAAGHPAR